MGAIEDRITSLGYSLPAETVPGGSYVPTVSVEGAGLVYTAGHVARGPKGDLLTGKLGSDLTVAEGYEAARLTAINCLAGIKLAIGDLDGIASLVRSLNFVGESSSLAHVCDGRYRSAGTYKGNVCRHAADADVVTLLI